MGICQEKASVNIRKVDRSSSADNRQSFLYNSFANDPTLLTDMEFFCFDVPHYTEIQYLLRKNYNQPSDGIEVTVENHIDEIEQFIKKLKGNQIEQAETAQKKEIGHQQNENCNQILNFQLISIHLTDSQTRENNLSFSIMLNEQQILKVQGKIQKNRWKPLTENKISKQGIKIDLEAVKQQTKIKVNSLEGKQILECTISCNKTTFKYIIPVLQISNIRRKLDNQPVGHINFRIQYIDDYKQHKLKVINDLEARKKGLLTILQKLRIENTSNLIQVDKTICLDNEQESFMTDKME